MSCKKDFSPMNAGSLVDEVVTIERSRGTKITAALAIAAHVLGLPPRRVYSHHYQPPARLTGTAETLQRFADYLARDIERSERAIAARRKLLQAVGEQHGLALAVDPGARNLLDQDQAPASVESGEGA